MKNDDTKSFLKDFLSLGAGTLIYMVIGVIGTPIITRLVDPADYGQMSILSVYSSIGLMLCGLGLDQTLLRYFYRDGVHYQRKLTHLCSTMPLFAAMILGAVLFIAYAAGLNWISLTELVLLEMNVIALIVNRFTHLVVRLRHHSKIYSAANIIQKLSYLIFSIVLITAIPGNDFVMLAAATIISALIAAATAIACELEIWRPAHGDCAPLIQKRELLLYGFPIMLSSGINVVFNALDKLFIEHFCTISDVGVYASAVNLIAVFSVVRTAFNTIWMPSAVSHYEKNPADKSFYRQGNAFISILMLAFGAAVVLFKDLFVLLLGEKYQGASMIVPFLMFEPIMYTISETTATGIVIQKKTAYQVIVAGGSCLVNFIGNYLLTPVMGPQGAALSTGISYIVFFALRTWLANRVFYVNYSLFRFAIPLSALFAFSVYGSNHVFSWIQVLMFIGVIATIIFAYWKECRTVVNLCVKRLKVISAKDSEHRR